MARQEIILGTAPTGLGGDPPRTASTKINAMTLELYNKNATLGTASIRNVQTSPTDTTSGAILTVGAFGGNGGFASLLNAGTNIDLVTIPGLYALNANYSGGPTGVTESLYVDVIAHGQGYLRQDISGITSSTSYTREQVNGTWGAWNRVYNSYNSVGNLSSGALIERGSNSNGNYTKYTDGTMECWIYLGDVSFAVGNSITLSWSYPVSFVGIPFVSAGGAMRAGSAIVAGSWQVYATSVTGTSIRLNPFASTVDNARDTMYFAKGRWKA